MAFRKIYQQIGAFAGPSPASGYHFIDYSGNPINNQYCTITGNTSGFSINRINSLQRVFEVTYGFNESRVDIKNMGDFGTIARPVITVPPITLNISYYPQGLINEAILGFVFNKPSGNISNNPSIYNVNVCPISGFLDRTFQPDYSDSFINFTGNHEYWLSTYRDSRNIFIATLPQENDLNFTQPTKQLLNGSQSNILKDSIYIYGFGDCYLNSYKFSAAIGNFPQASVEYVCDNLMYFSGGSGHSIPSVNPKDETIITGTLFNLPPAITGVQATVVLPGDMYLNITETGSPNISNVPINFADIKIQSFDIDLNLNREPLSNLGYRLPIDRVINPPIYANLNCAAIVGDTSTGSFIDFINNEAAYNFNININYSKKQPYTGTAISFIFKGAKFNNLQMKDAIQGERMVNFSITSELNPNTVQYGFFMSGQLGINSNNLPLY